MTLFEQELKEIVGDICPTATYVGRACYIELPNDNRAKIQFISPKIKDEYSALEITILNQKEGKVDNITLLFEDVLGNKKVSNPYFPQGLVPYIWTNKGKHEWYVYQPNQADYDKLQKLILDYLKVFDLNKDRNPSLDERLAETARHAEKRSTTINQKNTHDFKMGR